VRDRKKYVVYVIVDVEVEGDFAGTVESEVFL
jgi:hypothetical protein